MVRQTTCKHCGLDIEGHSPYPKGQWRDRGNNRHCNVAGLVPHEPVPFQAAQAARSRSRKPVKRSTSTARPEYRRRMAELCVDQLQAALQYAKYSGAPYTIERIRLALSSAKGAVRNAGYRVTRAQRG